jgi:hypothetical protein
MWLHLFCVLGEHVIEKSTFNAFHNTNLGSILRSSGKKKVLVCGLVTTACVLMTVHGAFVEGYDVSLVHDCCGDRTLERFVFTSCGTSLAHAALFRETNCENQKESVSQSNDDLYFFRPEIRILKSLLTGRRSSGTRHTCTQTHTQTHGGRYCTQTRIFTQTHRYTGTRTQTQIEKLKHTPTRTNTDKDA